YEGESLYRCKCDICGAKSNTAYKDKSYYDDDDLDFTWEWDNPEQGYWNEDDMSQYCHSTFYFETRTKLIMYGETTNDDFEYKKHLCPQCMYDLLKYIEELAEQKRKEIESKQQQTEENLIKKSYTSSCL
ncbi:hypothetical protein KY334_07040, partial [Candidatus Woesearchaeota archaeon]|nr:hypothetical protein [Candidatus Woesearchaeota archaeon]